MNNGCIRNAKKEYMLAISMIAILENDEGEKRKVKKILPSLLFQNNKVITLRMVVGVKIKKPYTIHSIELNIEKVSKLPCLQGNSELSDE